MKNEHTPDDSQLHALLNQHSARVTQRNPNFRASVWQRIEATRRMPQTWATWLRTNLFRVATLGTACVALAIVTAGILATTKTHREREQLLERYVASIDATQKTHLDHAHP